MLAGPPAALNHALGIIEGDAEIHCGESCEAHDVAHGNREGRFGFVVCVYDSCDCSESEGRGDESGEVVEREEPRLVHARDHVEEDGAGVRLGRALDDAPEGQDHKGNRSRFCRESVNRI